MRFPQLLNPHETARELIDLNQKVLKGIENLSRIREQDIQAGAKTSLIDRLLFMAE